MAFSTRPQNCVFESTPSPKGVGTLVEAAPNFHFNFGAPVRIFLIVLSKDAAYIGCALVMERVAVASTRGSLSSFLERLVERPMASALLEELKSVVTEGKGSQLKHAAGASTAGCTPALHCILCIIVHGAVLNNTCTCHAMLNGMVQPYWEPLCGVVMWFLPCIHTGHITSCVFYVMSHSTT